MRIATILPFRDIIPVNSGEDPRARLSWRGRRRQETNRNAGIQQIRLSDKRRVPFSLKTTSKENNS